jgi:hypothetical protein
MQTETKKVVTAEMKITRKDGTIEVHEVELDEDSVARILREQGDGI